MQRGGAPAPRHDVAGFQSSTRQTDFATGASPGGWPPRPRGFNPLRGRQTLQRGPGRLGGWGRLYVSILYEADRLCNGRGSSGAEALPNVSILYEADRLCNVKGEGRGQARTNGFNPLRGRQTLQLSIPPHSSQVNTFQSSTRQTDFATWVKRWLREAYGVSILYEADRLCNVAV